MATEPPERPVTDESPAPDVTTPPWSDEQVDALNTFQQSGFFHPFTCPNRSDGKHYEYGGDLGELVATTDGWTCRDCDYTQGWAAVVMLDKGLIESQRRFWRDREPHPDVTTPSAPVPPVAP